MNEWAGSYAGALVTASDAIDQDFNQRLRDSGTLAFRVAYGVLRHRQDAEDVAQDALARAFQHFSRLRDRDRFRAWLVRTTWRLAIDRWRANRRRTGREQDIFEDAATTEQSPEARERSAHLWRAIDELPEKLRVAIVLAAIEGHDIREVSRLLDVPEGTVKSRLFLGRKALAEKLRWMNDTTR